MNNLTKLRVDEMLALKKECEQHGINYDTFIAGCRVVFKQKKLTDKLLTSARKALKNIVYYGTERAKLQNKTMAELIASEPDFLAHGFQYCVSQDDGVLPTIRKYAAYCNINFNMFDPDEMQELAKKVAKKMQLKEKPSDAGYYDTVIQALPAYIKEDFPKSKGSAAISKFLSDLNQIVLERPSLARANAQCLPDARQYYLADEESFALEFFARQQEEPTVEGVGHGVTLVRQLGHYLICDESGMVLHDSLDPHQFTSLQYGDTTEWIAQRKEMIKSPEYIDLGNGNSSDDAIPGGLHVVRDNEGLIILATPEVTEANAIQCLYNAGGLTDDYIRQHIAEDYGVGDNFDVVVEAILKEASSKYDLSKFASDKPRALFAITPLLAAGIDKF